MYPFERFTEKAKKVLALAQDEAEKSHHSFIGTEHLLLGLLREGDGLAAKVLADLGVEIDQVRSSVESLLGPNERVIVQQIIPTSRVKKVIEIAFEEAKRMGNTRVGTGHILLGLLIEGEGIAAHVLEDLGANLEKVRAEMEELEQAGVTRDEGNRLPQTRSPTRASPGPGPLIESWPMRWSHAFSGPGLGPLPAGPEGSGSGPQLTAEAHSAVALAEEEGLHLGAAAVGTEHLLLGVLRQGMGAGATALAAAGAELGAVRAEVERIGRSGERPVELHWGPAAREAISAAVEEANGLPVGTGALLAACLGEGSRAAAVLRRLGIDPGEVRARLAGAGPGEEGNRA